MQNSRSSSGLSQWTGQQKLHFCGLSTEECYSCSPVYSRRSGTTVFFVDFPQWPYSEYEWRISQCSGLLSFFFSENFQVHCCVEKDDAVSEPSLVGGGRAWKLRMWTKSSQSVLSLSLEAWFMTLHHLMTTVVASFHSSVCVTPTLPFATSWNPKACRGRRYLLCTHVCFAWQTGPLQGAPAALLCRCY